MNNFVTLHNLIHSYAILLINTFVGKNIFLWFDVWDKLIIERPKLPNCFAFCKEWFLWYKKSYQVLVLRKSFTEIKIWRKTPDSIRSSSLPPKEPANSIVTAFWLRPPTSSLFTCPCCIFFLCPHFFFYFFFFIFFYFLFFFSFLPILSLENSSMFSHFIGFH